MAVNGEAYYLLNFWIGLLSLLLGARLARVRFRLGRALLSSALGGVYAIIAWMGPEALRGSAAPLCAMIGCTLLALGRGGLRAVPAVLAVGLLYGGMARVWLENGLPSGWFFPATGVWVPLLCGMPFRARQDGTETRLRLIYRGRTLTLPVLRDSGNALRDPLTGLPVIVLSVRAARPLLPCVPDVDDLSTLPPGFRFLRTATAAGKRTLMCFHPDRVTLRQGRRKWETDAVIALSGFSEARAVVPEILLRWEAGRHDAAHGNAEMDAFVFCAAQDRENPLYRRGGPAAPAADPAGGAGTGGPAARG